MKKAKAAFGIIFVVASTLKLASIWHIIHWSWLERIPADPWDVYLIAFLRK